MHTKSCEFCRKKYVGDGFKGVCTQDCYYRTEYSKKHEQPVKHHRLHEKPAPSKDAIKKSNENWVKKKKVQSSKQKRRINQLLNMTQVREKPWTGKDYNSVRG